MMLFNIEIGDWSGDGHDQSQTFLCRADATIQCLREAYFKVQSVIGIDLTEVCGEYGEEHMNIGHAEVLLEHEIIDRDMFDRLTSDKSYSSRTRPIDIAVIVRNCLNYVEPDYNVRFEKPQARIPSLHFSGFDSQGRHIGQIGYGVFGND
jgi:hypothetical protein